MTQELYKRYRPKSFKDVIGQDGPVSILTEMGKSGKTPHTILFVGPSGCGKTTLARILRTKLGCGDADFSEINSANFRGIDMVREIQSRVGLSPMSGKCRVWLIDEVHQLTGAAQDAFLKLLEDTPAHVYFLLATTNPEKLTKTLRNRCTTISLELLDSVIMMGLITSVLIKERKGIPQEVAEAIVEAAEGSPRKALVFLDTVIDLPSEKDQLRAISNPDVERKGVDLARVLMKSYTSWTSVSTLLRDLDEDPETIRWIVLGYARSVLVGSGKSQGRAYAVIEAFRDNFYDSKKAGLAAACYEILQS